VTVERHLLVTNTDVADLTAALSWAVRAVDTEFSTATMVKIVVEQTMQCDTDEVDWRYVWSAAVSGSLDEEAES
jgi:hypothetical protein